MNLALSHRFGGTITLGCDPLLEQPVALNEDFLYFSHGRAAMIWLLQNRGPFASAAVCAYTWPEIPRMLERYEVKLDFFDFGQKDIVDLVHNLPGYTLVVLPFFYGFESWIDPYTLAEQLDDKACVFVDAAQTAFGYLDYQPPVGGAVMSCPHKATALNDGSVLSLDRITEKEKEAVQKLDEATSFYQIKKNARELLGSADLRKENRGLIEVTKLEERWPSDPPQRMTRMSRKDLTFVDPTAHARMRRENYECLRQKLDHYLQPVSVGKGTPFAYAALVENRDKLLQKLHAKRVFATPLWHDAIFDESRHPVAADCAQRLFGLPVDQRYNNDDMDILAEMVVSCL